MEAKISWKGGARFDGMSGSGHTVTMDGPPDHGGENQGPRPMEMLLLGLGACTAFDVMHILKKSRSAVSNCEASIEADRSDEIPAVFTRIKVHFVVTGTDLKKEKVARAVSMSAEKYCSASIMLERGGVTIEHSFEIVDA